MVRAEDQKTSASTPLRCIMWRTLQGPILEQLHPLLHQLSSASVLQANSGRGAKLLQALKLLKPQLTNITIPGTGVPVEILAILDPLSKTAQKVAPVLDFLQKTLGIPLKVSLC